MWLQGRSLLLCCVFCCVSQAPAGFWKKWSCVKTGIHSQNTSFFAKGDECNLEHIIILKHKFMNDYRLNDENHLI